MVRYRRNAHHHHYLFLLSTLGREIETIKIETKNLDMIAREEFLLERDLNIRIIWKFVSFSSFLLRLKQYSFLLTVNTTVHEIDDVDFFQEK